MGYEVSDLKLQKEKRLGPRGGDLDRPTGRTEERQADFCPQDGDMGLHRFARAEASIPGRQKEQAWHRMAAYMLVAGVSNKQIAAAAGVQETTISQLKSNVWFQQLLAVIANEQGGEIMGLLKAEASESLRRMVEIRDTSESERLSYQAAKDLLELSHGKATQKVISDTTHRISQSPREEMDEIQRQLAVLKERNSDV